MAYLFEKYPNYLSLEVSTDNEKAVAFYKRVGLEIVDIYLSREKVEFAKFATPEVTADKMITLTKNKECIKSSVSNLNLNPGATSLNYKEDKYFNNETPLKN